MGLIFGLVAVLVLWLSGVFFGLTAPGGIFELNIFVMAGSIIFGVSGAVLVARGVAR